MVVLDVKFPFSAVAFHESVQEYLNDTAKETERHRQKQRRDREVEEESEEKKPCSNV